MFRTAVLDLLTEIDAYCERHSIGVATFGRLAVNDPAIIGAIRNGRNPRADTLDRLAAQLRVDPKPNTYAPEPDDDAARAAP